MNSFSFRIMTDDDIAELKSWYGQCTPESDRLDRYLEAPTTEWIEYVTTQDDAHAWAVIMDGEMVAHIQQDDWEPNDVALSIAVKPSRFGQGIATAALSQFIAEEISAKSRITACVMPSNHAALRLVRRLGFCQTASEPNAEGYLSFCLMLTGSEKT